MAHLTIDEEARLSQRIQAGDIEARNELVERNLGFAYFIAKQYFGLSLTFQELKSAACVGLMVAAERFISRPNCKFISYAVYWVRQAILKELSEQNTARVSLSQQQAERDVLGLLLETGSIEETAGELGRSEGWVEAVLDRRRTEFSVNIRNLSRDEEGELYPWEELIARLPDDNQLDMQALIEAEQLADCLGRALKYLRPREQFVLREYFGLNGDEEKTLDMIAEQLGVSRERTRQIKEKALHNLRKPRILDRLIERL